MNHVSQAILAGAVALMLTVGNVLWAAADISSGAGQQLRKDDSGAKDDAKADKKHGEGQKNGSQKHVAQAAASGTNGKPEIKAAPDAKAVAAPAASKQAETKDAKKEAAKSDGATADKDKPTTYKVKKRPLKVEVNLDGVFEARNMTEIVLHTNEWADLEVLKVVEHGTKVQHGDFLLALNTERIDRVIADLQREQALTKLALQEAELQLQSLQSTVPLDLASSDRSKRILEEDYEQFLKIDRPMSERIANFMVKVMEDYLSYEKEELRQLEKMYKADDLVEETEEIILKRARDSVARAQFNVERMKTERDAMLKLTLPRAEELLKLNRQRQEIDWKKSQVTIPTAKRRAELALEKLKIEAGRSEERLTKLLADRSWAVYRAPVTGVVYYGRCTRGKWSSADVAAEKLRRGSRLMNDEVVMTIVEPQSLIVRATLFERLLQHVKPGLKGFVQPTTNPDVKLTAIIDRINPAPIGGGFDTAITVALDDSAPALMPGMSCEARFVPFQKSDALTVPTAAVGADDQDPRKYFVSVVSKDGKSQKRAVTTGKRADKQVEILQGLSEGDEVLAEYPKE